MKIICKTLFPKITVDGLGDFKNGDTLEVTDENKIVVGHLLVTPEWEVIPEEKKVKKVREE